MSDKLDMTSPDLVNQNIEKLAQLFPNCITESDNGKVIDFDLLRQELSHAVVEGNKERYRLEWPGKREAIVTANLPTTKTLRPVREDSVDFDNTENLYIEGDNLEVLKLLQESYLGKIKMIYIDPPYNTGKDFVYKDNFSKDAQEELFDSGQKDEYNQRLIANPETAGRYHSDWLSMMYPRLKLARNLLSQDGVIFISIDDNEVHNLRRVADEIFGEINFVAQFTIASNSAKNNSKYVSVTHEYALCFSKSIESLPKGWKVKKTNLEEYQKIYNRLLKQGLSTQDIRSELLALVKYPKYYEFDHYTYIDEKGPFRASDLTAPSSKNFYDVFHPITKKPCKLGTRGWGFSPVEMQKLIDDDKILFGQDETTMPQLKNHLIDNNSSLPKSVLFFDSQASTKWIKKHKLGFDFPKSIDLIKYFISMYPEKDLLTLDFFSGSATSAHATIEVNSEDNGKRKYIQVQLPESTEEKSEAFKNGYKNICEIGKERIRRAAKKIKEETNADIDYGFRVFRLDESNMQDVYYKPQDYSQGQLDAFADNVKPDRTPDDLLAQVMLDWGLPLSLKIEQATIAGKQVFKVAENSLFACFDTGIDEAFAKAIAAEAPLRIVFKDSGFKDDTAKVNVKQLLKQLSPETEMKVI